jgi:predicted TIM-barrel fold metal-dependent hydrolase
MTILAPATRMPDIAALCDKFPDLTVVIDHMADCPIDRPDLLLKLTALKRYPKVFVKSRTRGLCRRKGFRFAMRSRWCSRSTKLLGRSG